MKKVTVIGISGGSGSGKTTFINALREHFSKEELCIVSQDEYYIAREDQVEDLEGVKNFDLPGSIDSKAFVLDVKKLKRGETVHRKEYTFNNELKQANIIEYLPAKVILVEGLFVLHDSNIRKLLDLKVFIEAKENLKVIRRIKRDRVERNYPLEDVLYRYQNHVLPSFEKYILPYKSIADIIINNNISYDKGLAVLKGYIQSILKNSDS